MQSSEADRVQSRLQSQSLQFAGGVGGVGRGGEEEEEGDYDSLFSNPAPKSREDSSRSLPGELQSPGTTPASGADPGNARLQQAGKQSRRQRLVSRQQLSMAAYQHRNTTGGGQLNGLRGEAGGETVQAG